MNVSLKGSGGVAALLAAALFLSACTGEPELPRPSPQSGTERESRADRGEPGERRPNVIVIVTDDQRADQLEGMDNVHRLLAGHGVTFSNAFVTTSFCCPSRASILTGQYSRTHGVWGAGGAQNGHRGTASFDDDSTVATWLDDAGYHTSLAGKYLNGYGGWSPMWPPGWDDWFAFASLRSAVYYDYDVNDNGRTVHFGTEAEDYSTQVLADHAAAQIADSDAPLFLYLAPVAPHDPRMPALEDAAAEPPEWSWAPSVNEEDLSDKPWGQGAPKEEMRKLEWFRSSAYRSLLSVDRMVGQLIDALRDAGELQDTIIIFTSDNGFLYGEHRLLGKIWPYEESIRVPMIVRVPWIDRPVVRDEMVLNIDIAATVAELAGVDPGLAQDGRSLLPLLKSRDPKWRDAFLVEYLDDPREEVATPRFVALRTTNHMYIEYDNGDIELYDLAADPYQLDNLAGDPAVAELQAALAARLEAADEDPSVLEPAERRG